MKNIIILVLSIALFITLIYMNMDKTITYEVCNYENNECVSIQTDEYNANKLDMIYD